MMFSQRGYITPIMETWKIKWKLGLCSGLLATTFCGSSGKSLSMGLHVRVLVMGARFISGSAAGSILRAVP